MYNWFKIFNATEFEALGLVSKTYTLDLVGVGRREILVTKGVGLGMLYEDIFLSLELTDFNPFVFEGHAIARNDLDDIYLGIEVDES